MFSIIVVHNSEDIERELLLTSLARQTVPYELILLENKNNRNYTSAASALNDGAKKATGEYLLFVHQDVDLLDSEFLSKAEELLADISDLGVAGVAGMKAGDMCDHERRRNRICQGSPKGEWGKVIDSVEKVQTLDECLLIVPSKVFSSCIFDVSTCDHWHLYGVEYCLSILKFNLAAYVLPLPIYHTSVGDSAKPKRGKLQSLDDAYFRAFESVRKKHRANVSYVYTTCASFSTKTPIFIQRIYRLAMRKLRIKVV